MSITRRKKPVETQRTPTASNSSPAITVLGGLKMLLQCASRRDRVFESLHSIHSAEYVPLIETTSHSGLEASLAAELVWLHIIPMSDRADWTLQRRLLLGALACAVLLIVGYFIFVSLPWGHQFDDDAYFGRRALSRKVVKLDSDILELVSKTTLLLVAMILLVIAALRRCALVGVITVAAFGCAVVGAEVVKSLLPWRALVSDDALLGRGLEANSYPSGHATIGTSLALSLLLISPSRWRPWLTVAAGCLSAAYATSVLFTGWHRPSDALGALAWSGLCMTLAAAFAVQLRGRPRTAIAHPGRAILGSAGLAILVAAATWVIAARGAADYPYVDLPFLVLSELVIAGAFALTAWYGWQLRAVDWPSRPGYYRTP